MRARERPRILVAGTAALLRDHLVALRAEGYDVRSVADGEAALGAMRTDVPDLVLSEVALPRLDGLALLRSMRADPTTRRISMILVSGAADEEVCIRGLSAGADDYLVTPLRPQALAARVSRALAIARQRRDAVAREEEVRTTLNGILTDRKRAEEALRRSEQRFRRTFELGLIGMAIISPTKRCLEVNDKICAILGYSREELMGMSWAQITHPDDLAADVAQFNRVMAGEIDGYTVDKRCIRKDGQVVDTTKSLKCVRGEHGVVDYFVALLQDMTERKRELEERKALLASEREARSIAEASSRVKDEFLATLSHELRSPIASGLLWLHLLRIRKVGPGALDKTVDAIDECLRAQARLIDDLLDLSRISAGKLRIQVGTVDVSAAVETAVNAALPAASAKGVTLRSELRGPATSVRGDAARLQQVFSNLLTNAIKFTPKGGEVSVQLQRFESSLEVTVRDSGQGIDPELLPHVFERFRQGDSSATRSHGGLGLGLAIVKHLVDLHGGWVSADSEGRDRGATFVVWLPAVRDAADAGDEPAAPLPAEMDLSGVRVLVVDDEPSTRTAMARILDEYNARTETAGNAEEAMARLADWAPDVLISDIGMPGTDGYEFMRGVRASEAYRSLPAIALTAFTRPEDRVRALQAGYDTHLPKPVDPNELLTVIASLVRQARLAAAGGGVRHAPRDLD